MNLISGRSGLHVKKEPAEQKLIFYSIRIVNTFAENHNLSMGKRRMREEQKIENTTEWEWTESLAQALKQKCDVTMRHYH